MLFTGKYTQLSGSIKIKSQQFKSSESWISQAEDNNKF